MQLGRISDQNLARTATFDEEVGEWMLPLSNLAMDERYKGAPARCDATDLAKSRFRLTLKAGRLVSLIGVLFHTMSLAARYRLTIVGKDLDWENPAYVGEWLPVYARRFRSSTLKWEVTNWWGGQGDQEEIDLYPRHLWIVPPPFIAGGFQIEFDDTFNEDGVIDIGGLWLAQSFSPAINFDRGRDLAIVARDLLDEGPSGRIFAESRTPRRELSVPWSNLKTAEAYRFVDMAMRVSVSRPVIFVPDLDDPVSMIREAYPALMQRPPGPRLTRERLNSVAATFREILA